MVKEALKIQIVGLTSLAIMQTADIAFVNVKE